MGRIGQTLAGLPQPAVHLQQLGAGEHRIADGVAVAGVVVLFPEAVGREQMAHILLQGVLLSGHVAAGDLRQLLD